MKKFKTTTENVDETQSESEVKTLTIEEVEDKEDDALSKQITELQEEEERNLKRKKKKAAKERLKLNERLNLKMVLKGDSGPMQEDVAMFNLNLIKSKQQLTSVTNKSPDIVVESDEDFDAPQRPKRVIYDKDVPHLDKDGLYYADSGSEIEMEPSDDESINSTEGLGLGDSDNDEKNDSVKENNYEKQQNPLLVDLDTTDVKTRKAHKAQLWFTKDVLKEIEDEMDEDLDLDKMAADYKMKGGTIIGENIKSKATSKNDLDNADSESDSDSEYEFDNYKKKKHSKEIESPSKSDKGIDFEIVKKNTALKKSFTVSDLALGSMMVSSKKTKRNLIDAGWNRYAFNDTNLPEWFEEDEKKHMRKEAPVPKELIDEYAAKMRELNAGPIKKVIEAKARKKKRIVKKMERARKRAETLMDNPDVSQREKARLVKQMYSKAKAEPKREVTYVVSRKFTASKKVQRPAGVKGRFRAVDPRLKKDIKAAKRTAKRNTKTSAKRNNRRGPANTKSRTPQKKDSRKKT